MTDYRDQYNETSDKTTRQNVKSTPAQWQNPYEQAPYTPEEMQPARHRRADKYETAPKAQPAPARNHPVFEPIPTVPQQHQDARSAQGPVLEPIVFDAPRNTNGDTKMFVTPAPDYTGAPGADQPARPEYRQQDRSIAFDDDNYMYEDDEDEKDDWMISLDETFAKKQ